MSNQLERLDLQSFSLLPASEAREVLGGYAEEFQDEAATAGGYTFSNPSTTTTTKGTFSDKDQDDTWS